MNRRSRLNSVPFLVSASLLFALSGIATSIAGPLPSFGACCLPFGLCEIKEPLACAVIEGAYQGDGTTCESTECPIPTTTTTTSTTTSTLPSILCGDANDDEQITAPDALVALKTSVGTAQCIPERCDYNGNGLVQSSDALLILRVSVGLSIEPQCPSTTTTTTSTTTSTLNTTTTTLFPCGNCPTDPPYGSYIDSCVNCSVTDCKLSCRCADEFHDTIACHHDPESCHATEIDLLYCKVLPGGGIDNNNGNLTCVSCPAPVCGGWNPEPTGSYSNSCMACSLTDCTFSCFCKTIQSGYRDTTINLEDCDPAHGLSNNDGYLSCTPK